MLLGLWRDDVTTQAHAPFTHSLQVTTAKIDKDMQYSIDYVSPTVSPQNAAILGPCFSLLLSGSLSSQEALEVQRLLGFQLTDQALHGLGTNQKMLPLLTIAALSLAILAC